MANPNAFGVEPSEEIDVDAIFADDPPEQPAAEEPAKPAPEPAKAPEPEPTPAEPTPAPEEAQPEPVAQEPTPEGQEPPAEPTAEQVAEEERKWAQKYKTPEDLEAAYENVQAWNTRTSQENARLKQELQDAQAFREQAAPILQRLIQAQQQQPQEEIDFTDPQAMQGWAEQVRQQARAEAEEAANQRFTQAQNEAAVAEGRGELEAFRTEHPDSIAREQEMANIIKRLRTDPETDQENYDDFPINKHNLEVAHSLAADPQLYRLAELTEADLTDANVWVRLKEARDTPGLAEAVVANPHWIETDAGMKYARQSLALPQGVTAAQTGAEADKAQQAAQEKAAAYVERGSMGAPVQSAPGERPEDWFINEVVNLDKESKTSAFGV